jgi:hypothetical protein
MRVGLVGCVKAKLSEPSRVEDLYTSTLFRGRRAYVRRTCDRWFVLSAKYGLLDLDEVIAPYDETLTRQSVSARRAWSATVLRQLEQRLGALSGQVFEVHAGAAYRDFGVAEGLTRRGATVEVPAAGLLQGQQLRFYRDARGAP